MSPEHGRFNGLDEPGHVFRMNITYVADSHRPPGQALPRPWQTPGPHG